ncbi:hypothetical protein DDT52_02385 [Brenneria roseae subsp. roseae]|nr:hypothetical protein DDT52_02385 [Brenneria roseae subsp. roseae]
MRFLFAAQITDIMGEIYTTLTEAVWQSGSPAFSVEGCLNMLSLTLSASPGNAVLVNGYFLFFKFSILIN